MPMLLCLFGILATSWSRRQLEFFFIHSCFRFLHPLLPWEESCFEQFVFAFLNAKARGRKVCKWLEALLKHWGDMRSVKNLRILHSFHDIPHYVCTLHYFTLVYTPRIRIDILSRTTSSNVESGLNAFKNLLLWTSGFQLHVNTWNLWICTLSIC